MSIYFLCALILGIYLSIFSAGAGLTYSEFVIGLTFISGVLLAAMFRKNQSAAKVLFWGFWIGVCVVSAAYATGAQQDVAGNVVTSIFAAVVSGVLMVLVAAVTSTDRERRNPKRKRKKRQYPRVSRESSPWDGPGKGLNPIGSTVAYKKPELDPDTRAYSPRPTTDGIEVEHIDPDSIPELTETLRAPN